MFALRKDWFTPNERYPDWRIEFLSMEELGQAVEREVRKSIDNSCEEFQVESFRLVLEEEKYNQLKTTVRELLPKKKTVNETTNIVQPLLVYHSTQNVNKVNSIIRYGYLVPGQKHPTQGWSLKMQNGNFYGDGIYCSPDFDVTKWYSFVDFGRSIQLIVNILIPGCTFVYDPFNVSDDRQSLTLDAENGIYSHCCYDKENKLVTECSYHTIRSPNMDVWVSGAGHRLIPVALVTVKPSRMGKMRALLDTKDMRETYSETNLVGEVVFHRFAYSDYYSVRPGRLFGSIYFNPYQLLLWQFLLANFLGRVDYGRIHMAASLLFEKVDSPENLLDLGQLNLTKLIQMMLFGRVDSPEDMTEQEQVAGLARFVLQSLSGKVKSSEATQGPKLPKIEVKTTSIPEELRQNCGDVMELSRELVKEHGGRVPLDRSCLDALQNLDSQTRQSFRARLGAANRPQTAQSTVLRHFAIVPSSLMTNRSFAKSVSNFLQSFDHGEKFLSICSAKLINIPVKNVETVMQAHNDIPSIQAEEDCLIQPLGDLIDIITDENDNEKYVNVLYLFVFKPRDLDQIDAFIEQWRTYVALKKILMKLVFLDEVYDSVCRLKSYIQTLDTLSCNFFFHTNLETLDDTLDITVDELENEDLRVKSIETKIPFPLGIAGEGFLKAVTVQPSWDVKHVDSMLFKGSPPEFLMQDSQYYVTHVDESLSGDSISIFSHCVFRLLASFQNFIFKFPDRAKIYGDQVKELAECLLFHIGKVEGSGQVPISVLRGMKYKLSGFLSTMEAFGGVTFKGKWYTNLTKMKFGRQVARRVKQNFDWDGFRLLSASKQRLINEPSDYLQFMSRTGRPVRVRTTAASQIEPWLIIVDYVSLDEDGSSAQMFMACEQGHKIKDSRGRVVTDVLLISTDNDNIAKMYCGYVFTRNPYLYIPSQTPALIVNSMTTCIETAFRLCVDHRHRWGVSAEFPDEIIKEVEDQLKIAFGLLDQVRQSMRTRNMLDLIGAITVEETPGMLLTELFGIKSINQVLVTLMLKEASHLPASERWPRLCFGLLAEAVMRNCRARVRTGKYTAEQLIDRALFITPTIYKESYVRDIKRSSQSTNAFMAQTYSNCSPFKTVAVLYFVKLLHADTQAQMIANAFIAGDVSMGSFLHEYLPGFGGYITQLALYLQGMDCMKSKHRQNTRFENPRHIVDEIISQRLQHHEIQRLKKRKTRHWAKQRRLIRMAEAEPYRQYHEHPKLFTTLEVNEMNRRRPADDQLEVMQNGLLVHHCSCPKCPDYLRNFMTEKDRRNGMRNGLMNHLRHDQNLGTYERSWHVNCHKYATSGLTLEQFLRKMRELYPDDQYFDEFAPTQYRQYMEFLNKTSRAF